MLNLAFNMVLDVPLLKARPCIDWSNGAVDILTQQSLDIIVHFNLVVLYLLFMMPYLFVVESAASVC